MTIRKKRKPPKSSNTKHANDNIVFDRILALETFAIEQTALLLELREKVDTQAKEVVEQVTTEIGSIHGNQNQLKLAFDTQKNELTILKGMMLQSDLIHEENRELQKQIAHIKEKSTTHTQLDQ